MTSRSLRHRRTRRYRSVSARPIASHIVPDRPVQVAVSVTDFATNVTESFLIMPGQVHHALLTGFVETNGWPRVLKVPLEIRVRS